MSTDYRIWCLDCKEFDVEISTEVPAHQILALATELADLSVIANKLDVLDVEVTRFSTVINPQWFADHRGHKLVVQDEYGRESDQCRKLAKCSHCGHPNNCSLKANHEGDCKIKVRA